MKSVTLLFNQLLRDVHSQSWNEDELAKLSGVELQALAKLFACPSSGVKQSVIVRLLAHRQLRLKLAPFTDDPLPLAQSMPTQRPEVSRRNARGSHGAAAPTGALLLVCDRREKKTFHQLVCGSSYNI